MVPASWQLSCAVLAAFVVFAGDSSRAEDVDAVLEADYEKVTETNQAEQSVRKHAGFNGNEASMREQVALRQHDVASKIGLKNEAVKAHKAHKVQLAQDVSAARGTQKLGRARADPNVCVLGGGDKAFEKITEPLGQYIAEQSWNLVSGDINRGVVLSVRQAFKKTADHKGKSIQFYDPKDTHKDETNADQFVEQETDDGAAKLEICAVVVALPGGRGVVNEIEAAKVKKLPIAAFLTENEMITVKGKEENANALVKEKMKESGSGEVFMENDFSKLKEFLTKHMKDVSSAPSNNNDKADSKSDFDVCVLGGGDKSFEKMTDPLGKFIGEQTWNLVTGNINAGPVPRVREAFSKSDHKGKSIQYYAPKDNFKDEKFAEEFVEQDSKDGAAKIKICEVVVAFSGGPGVVNEIQAAKELNVPIAAFLTEKEMIKVNDKEENANALVKKKMEDLGLQDKIFMEDDISKVQDFLKELKSGSGANLNVRVSLSVLVVVAVSVFVSGGL